MNTKESLTPKTPKKSTIPGKPSNSANLLFALAAFAAAAVLPEFGFISAVVICTAMFYMSSARAFFPIMLIPFAGAAVAYIRAGYIAAGVCGVLILAPMIAGFFLNRGGFHKSLMVFTFVMLVATVGAAAFFMWYYRITVAQIYDAYSIYMSDAVSGFVSTAGTRLTVEDAKYLAEQYDSMKRTLFLYMPVAVAWMIEICGIIALRLTGLFHDLTGSIMYPRVRRVHIVNKVFAVFYFVSLFLGLAGGDIVGISAANVMLVLAVPAASAGISEIRRSIILRRLSGKRGFPVSVLIVVLATLGLSIGVGLMVLGVIGCFSAFRKSVVVKKK